MIRKWILASVASAVMAVGMVGCGEEPVTPPVKKPDEIKTETPAVKTETPAVKTETPAVKTETKTE